MNVTMRIRNSRSDREESRGILSMIFEGEHNDGKNTFELLIESIREGLEENGQGIESKRLEDPDVQETIFVSVGEIMPSTKNARDTHRIDLAVDETWDSDIKGSQDNSVRVTSDNLLVGRFFTYVTMDQVTEKMNKYLKRIREAERRRREREEEMW